MDFYSSTWVPNLKHWMTSTHPPPDRHTHTDDHRLYLLILRLPWSSSDFTVMVTVIPLLSLCRWMIPSSRKRGENQEPRRKVYFPRRQWPVRTGEEWGVSTEKILLREEVDNRFKPSSLTWTGKRATLDQRAYVSKVRRETGPSKRPRPVYTPPATPRSRRTLIHPLRQIKTLSHPL